MKIFVYITLLVILAGGTGCAIGHKEGGGALLGAGTGALIGSQIGQGSGQAAAIAIGALAGALIGQDVGRTLDRADQMAMQTSSQSALETSRTNTTSSWVNPDTGHSGSLTPTRTYQNSSGRYCREYQQNVIINGQQQEAFGTACRQPDGTWRIISTAQQDNVQQVTKVRYVDPDPYYYRDRPYYRYGYPYWYYPPFNGFFSFSYSHHSGRSYKHRHPVGKGNRAGHFRRGGFRRGLR